MRRVGVRDFADGREVGRIQQVDGLHPLLEGVAALNGVALGEALGGGELEAVIPGVAGVLVVLMALEPNAGNGESSVWREVVVPV